MEDNSFAIYVIFSYLINIVWLPLCDLLLALLSSSHDKESWSDIYVIMWFFSPATFILTFILFVIVFTFRLMETVFKPMGMVVDFLVKKINENKEY